MISDFTVALEEHDYDPVTDFEENGYSITLYLYRKSSKNKGWIEFYKPVLTDDEYKKYSENLGSETLAGVYLVEKDDSCYAVTHGHAHFIARQYCDKDFGLNLAERIIDPAGLKMKHSQTFTSNSKKDITSYTQRRKVESSFDYGEAFSYVKCKTVDKKAWGETVDFGESARFTSGETLPLTAKTVIDLVERIRTIMDTDVAVKLPRYRAVKSKELIESLKKELIDHFDKYLTNIDVDDYWLTGVSFNFTNEYKYALKFRKSEFIPIRDYLDIETIKKAILDHKETINKEYDLLRVQFYDEDNEFQFSKKLLELIQVTIDYDGKYYVLFHGEWVEFSESYVKYIEEQVDNIAFEIKESNGLSENDLISEIVKTGNYIQLHKENVYISKYCVEKADLMDNENVIMIKNQHSQSDLVYLVKQATTSLRLSDAGELGEHIFKGKNLCLWMLLNRKTLKKLSDLRSFHLLDAINDFKKEVTEKGLTPIIWISLNNSDI